MAPSVEDPVSNRAGQQSSIVRREQLRKVASEGHIPAQIAARRWRTLSSTVVALHNGPLDPEQQRWAAVLAAGSRAALAGRTALAAAGLQNWDDERIHVVGPPGSRMTLLPDVPAVLHQSRTLTDDQFCRAALRDIDGGAQALTEIDFGMPDRSRSAKLWPFACTRSALPTSFAAPSACRKRQPSSEQRQVLARCGRQ
jgi:hypothetical protein